MELQSYGFGENQHTISGTPAVQAEGQRLTYQWDVNVQEWFVNDQRGLEHGFTVKARPASRSAEHRSARGEADAPKAEQCSALLSFTLAVRGGLRPHVAADALGVDFRDTAGATVLTYAGLKVWDADGKVLPSRFETVDGGTRHSVRAAGEEQNLTSSLREAEDCAPTLRLLVDERGARYPLTIDPVAQQANLKPADVGTWQDNDFFGRSVAVSGDTVVVGANGESSDTTGVNSTPDENASDIGAAYVFVRVSGVWTQQAYLKPAAVGTTQVGDQFGISVAVSGDTVVVGAFTEDSSTTGVDSIPNEDASASGAAYVFVRSACVWTQQAYLKPAAAGPTQAGDRFGASVAVSGDTVVVGAWGEDSSTTGVNSTPNDTGGAFFNSGAAYVFVRSAGAWTHQANLKPAAVGPTQAGDKFGASVAVAGDTVVVGAWGEDSSTTGVNSTPNDTGGALFDSGAAYVFVRSAGVWTQQAYLKPAAVGTSQSNDQFGTSVAVAGDTAVVGALNEDSSTAGVNSIPNESASGAGAAYIFVRSAGVWTQQGYLKPAAVGTTQAGDQFGISVAVAGETVVVGANSENSSTTGVNSTPNEVAADSGAAYVFVRSAGVWTQQAYLKPAAVGNWQVGDQFGASVAVSGDTVVVGAWGEDSRTTGVNSTPNESAVDSGAAYIFTTAAVVPSPMINPQSLTVLGNGAFQFTFPNADNTAFNVLATSDVSLPTSNWTDLGNATSIGGGVYQFTDPAATGFIRRFYQLRFP